MDHSDAMDWVSTERSETLLPSQVLTIQRDRLIAKGGRRIMGLVHPVTESTHRPTLTKRVLEKGSPRRHWNRLLDSINNNNNGGSHMNVDYLTPGSPMSIDTPPFTPRKRVIDEVDEPEKYEDHFSRPEEYKTIPNAIESLNDVTMEDVFTPPSAGRLQPASWPQVDLRVEGPFMMRSIGLGSPDRVERRPNWFELRAQAEKEEIERQEAERQSAQGITETIYSNEPLQFEDPSHGAFDSSLCLPPLPGSWPPSPPRPTETPADLPSHPQKAQIAQPSPASRPNEFLMAGGIVSATQGRMTVVSRPEDIQMAYLEPEPFISKTNGSLQYLRDLPKFVLDFWGKWVLQTGAKVIQSVKRRAVGVWTPQTAASSPRTSTHARRDVDSKRDKKLRGMSMEQRRAFRLEEKRLQRKKSTVPFAQDFHAPKMEAVAPPMPPSVPVKSAHRRRHTRERSKPAKSSIKKIRSPTSGEAIAPGRVTKQRKERPAKKGPVIYTIIRRGGLDAILDKERIREREEFNLAFISTHRPIQVVTPEPEPKPEPELQPELEKPVSPAAPLTPGLDKTPEPLPPTSVLETPTSTEPCIERPQSPVGAIPTDEPPRGESYGGYAQRSAKPSTRSVHWHLASSPLGPPAVDIRVYDPSAPVRPRLRERVEDGQQSARVTIDDKSPEGPFIKPLSSKWDSRLVAEMCQPDGRRIGTTISGDPLTRRDFATCYTPLAWLNDEVINAYIAIILDYARRASGSSGRLREPKYHAFNSFFYSTLRDRGYESVRRWASRAKIGGPALLGVEIVLIPIHNSNHWTLMVVKPKARTIEYFDSLRFPSRPHVTRVKEWLRGELRDLFHEEEWRVLPTDSPLQDNSSDCGVFLLTTAKMVVLGLPLSFCASDIPTIRKRIVAEILNGGFEGDFDPKVEFTVRSRM